MRFPDLGMAFGNPDFVRLAEAYGARRPTSASDFGAVLARCLETPGVHLIDLPIDYGDMARASFGAELAAEPVLSCLY